MNENDRARGAKAFRRELIAGIIILVFLIALFATIFINAITIEEQPDPLPKPVYTNNHGQSLVVVPQHLDLKKWMEAHPNAKIISLGMDWGNNCFIIYEEEADE